jgi:hypothetical protein
MTLTPQLEPTDFAQIERVAARGEREQAFRDNTIYRHEEPQGTRYTKGNIDGSTKRSWQSLDAVLRSDENSSAALPVKQLRRSRVFTALAIASSILFVAGVAATARDGFSFSSPSAGNGVLLGGALGSVAFGVLAGVLFRRASKGYDRAVDVYNDSLGLRLGVMTPAGVYVPPAEVEVDAEGYVITEDRLAPGAEGPVSRPQPSPVAPAPVSPAPGTPAPTSTTTPPATSAPGQPMPPAAPAPAAQPIAPAPGQPAPVVPPPRLGAAGTAPSGAAHTSPGAAPRRALPVGALTLLPQR